MSPSSTSIVELNVGGVFYTTSLRTLCSDPKSKLCRMFAKIGDGNGDSSAQPPEDESEPDFDLITKDSKGKYFIDRDGVLFRYILDFLRNKKLQLPENFQESSRLCCEAEYFSMSSMLSALRSYMSPVSIVPEKQQLQANSSLPLSAEGTSGSPLATTPTSPRPRPTDMSGLPGTGGSIVLGYRGTFAFGRDGMADVCFRKLTRILVHGKVNLCREIFGDTLNESRDPDRGGLDRYTSRFFLKHTSLEQAFDMLLDQNFVLAGMCGTGTSTSASGNSTAQPLSPDRARA